MNSDKLIVALDVPTLSEAEKIVEELSPVVRTFKVGKELFTSAGPAVVEMVHSYKARVFLDLKFHDIPNTVAAACQAAARLKVFMLNVHALGGKNMLAGAAEAIKKIAETEKLTPPVLLAVTVLTSMSDADLNEVGITKTVKEEVEDLALLSKASGMNGVVASGHEIGIIRKAAGKDFVIVTPGVRPAWAAQQDQKRIITPKEAVESGANYIVVGRPITQYPNPKEAARKIIEEIG